MKIKIETLNKDESLYPRTQVSRQHAEAIANAIKIGSVMPPIKIDRKTKKVLDGWHRIEAHEMLGLSEIEAEQISCKNEAEMFAIAVEANAEHGRPYSIFERARIQQRAEELGFTIERVSTILKTPVEMLSISKAEAYGKDEMGAAVTLKRTIKWKAGSTLTPRQVEANKKLAGMPASFYAQQLIELIESDLINWDDHRTAAKLMKLRELLAEMKALAEI